jgi:hypothetical protein
LWADTPKADLKGVMMPSHLKMDASLSNNNVPFMTGSTEINMDYSKYDSTLPETSVNSPTVSATVSLNFTAPSKPWLELNMTAQGKVFDFQGSSAPKLDLRYNRYVNGNASPSRTVSISLDKTKQTAQLTELSSAMSVSYDQSKDLGAINIQGVQRGQLKNNVFYFSDGSYVTYNLWP